MKRLRFLLGKDVHIRTSHLWIVGLGVVIGFGFLVDCIIAPLLPNICAIIDYNELMISAAIVAGLEAARKIVMAPFKYLNDLTISNTEKSPEALLREKVWMPCVGWFLVGGYAINIMLLPFIKEGINEVDWSFLHATVSIFLTLSGMREYGVYARTEKQAIDEMTSENQTKLGD